MPEHNMFHADLMFLSHDARSPFLLCASKYTDAALITHVYLVMRDSPHAMYLAILTPNADC